MNAKKFKGFIHMVAPTICACLASVGVVATAVLSARAALKVDDILKDETLSVTEKGKAVAPAFIPAALSGVATLGFIFAANILGEKQRAALLAGLMPMYKRCVKNRDEMYAGDYTPSGSITFYDKFSDRYFERTMEEVLEAEYHLNRNFILRGYAPLNELYKFLGLAETEIGEKLGWSQEAGGSFYGYEWIDFYHDATRKGGKDIFVIKFPFPPTDDYLADPYDM